MVEDVGYRGMGGWWILEDGGCRVEDVVWRVKGGGWRVRWKV